MTAAILPQFDPSEVRNTPDATGRVPQVWLDSHGIPFSPVAVSTTAVRPLRYEPKRPKPASDIVKAMRRAQAARRDYQRAEVAK